MRLAAVLIYLVTLSAFAEAEVNPCDYSRFAKDAVNDFLYENPSLRDGYLGLQTPIRGEPIRATVKAGGQRFSLFRKLGEGGDGIAYLGFYEGKVSIIKIPKESTAPVSYEREIILSDYLPKKGYRAAKVIASFPKERILVEEFIPGFYKGDLEKARKAGLISKKQYDEASAKLKDLQHRLKSYQRTAEFRDFSGRSRIPTFIDTHASNFLYSNGEWVVIDP